MIMAKVFIFMHSTETESFVYLWKFLMYGKCGMIYRFSVECLWNENTIWWDRENIMICMKDSLLRNQQILRKECWMMSDDDVENLCFKMNIFDILSTITRYMTGKLLFYFLILSIVSLTKALLNFFFVTKITECFLMVKWNVLSIQQRPNIP